MTTVQATPQLGWHWREPLRRMASQAPQGLPARSVAPLLVEYQGGCEGEGEGG